MEKNPEIVMEKKRIRQKLKKRKTIMQKTRKYTIIEKMGNR